MCLRGPWTRTSCCGNAKRWPPPLHLLLRHQMGQALQWHLRVLHKTMTTQDLSSVVAEDAVGAQPPLPLPHPHPPHHAAVHASAPRRVQTFLKAPTMPQSLAIEEQTSMKHHVVPNAPVALPVAQVTTIPHSFRIQQQRRDEGNHEEAINQ